MRSERFTKRILQNERGCWQSLDWAPLDSSRVIRGIDSYGDPQKWVWQSRGLIYTSLSFLNTTKYPPSLLYLLMTLGPAILALAVFEAGNAKAPTGLQKFFITFGRVPLFFYLLQWPTAHLISLLLHFAAGKPTWWLFKTPIDWNNIGPDMGFNLVVVYLSWIAVCCCCIRCANGSQE
jgi:uncharacterized membrane protein